MRWIVVGTGTEIGKTHVSLALLRALSARGAVGLKPIETGFDVLAPGTSDGERLRDASSAPVRWPPPVRLGPALAPWLAAPDTPIDLDACVAWIDAHEASVVLVETAGALLSPLSRTLTNLDLCRAARPDRVILVAPDRLGCLHDVAATSMALRAHADVPRAHVVLSTSLDDSSTGTNAPALEALGLGPVIGTLPHAPLESAATHAAASALVDVLLGAG